MQDDPNSWPSQIHAVKNVISSLPHGGLIRSHFERSIEGAYALIAAANVAASRNEAAQAPLPSSSSSPPPPPSSLLSSFAARLEAASALPVSVPPSSAGALALAVHALILSSPVGLVVTGAADTPRGAAFASPHRPVPPSVFAPPGWDEDLIPNVNDGAAHFRYQKIAAGGGGRTGHGTLFVTLTVDAPTDTLRIRARIDRTIHGGGATTASLELPIHHFVTEVDPSVVYSSPQSFFAAAAAPLDDVILFHELSSSINALILDPIFGEAAVEVEGMAGGGGSSSPPPPPQQQQQQELPASNWLPSVPQNGHYPGDFDADAFPDVRMGVPGALLHRHGGMTVGPDHPLFGRGREGGGGYLMMVGLLVYLQVPVLIRLCLLTDLLDLVGDLDHVDHNRLLVHLRFGVSHLPTTYNLRIPTCRF